MEPDRITVSAGRRISLTRYDGFNISVSYERDRMQGESPAEAIRKTETLVLAEFERLVDLCENGKIRGAKKEREE